MFSLVLLPLLGSITFIPISSAFPDGAPKLSCSSMTPQHGHQKPQNSHSPFLLATDVNGSNGRVKVNLGSASRIEFKGFLIQAHFTNSTLVKGGTFISTPDQSKLLGCGGGTQNSLTHVDDLPKNEVIAIWQPPSNFNEKVIFKATVCQRFDTFWVGIESNPVVVPSIHSNQVAVADIQSNSVADIQSNSVAVSGEDLVRSTEIPSAQAQQANNNNVYADCGSVKGCFGLPSTCVEKQVCQVVLTYSIVDDNAVQFEMAGALGNTDGWIAMGLSEDNKMGSDSVTECVLLGDKVAVRQSWNVPRPRKNNELLPEQHNGIFQETGSYEEGVMTCRWKRPFVTTVKGQTFDLLRNQYYILLSKGPLNTAGDKIIHSSRLPSANPVNLTSVSVVIGKPSRLIKIHGSFMIAAWIGFISVGILIARHYKEVWTKYKLCGTNVWFAVHRCFMLLSVSLVIAAFVLIFIHVDGWSNVGKNPHPLLGCIATALIVFQPLIAMCRPSPMSPKRPIFRWIHGMIGNGGQIFACVTMFFAVGLKEANLPVAFYWVLLTFLIFHCLVHLLIHVHTCFMERERELESNGKLDQFNFDDGQNDKDASGSSFKKFVLGLYMMVNIGLSAALILMVCLN